MTPKLTCRLMASLPDAMIVRRLRNTCASYMTNAREPMGRLAQARWYFKHYRPALAEQRFRVYLFFDGRVPVGYGALQLKDGELLVTECVDSECRGRHMGTAILTELIAVARREQRDLIAEIWTSNGPSIGLHEKAGFELEKTVDHQGESLSVYRLRAAT